MPRRAGIRLFAMGMGCVALGLGGSVRLSAFQVPLQGLPSGTFSSLDELASVSRAVRAAASRIRPALVTIESFGGVGTKPGEIGGIRTQGEGNTTGVMVTPDGIVATSCFNFIGQPSVITVITADGQRRVARLLGRDLTRQLCLLQVEGMEEHPVPEFAPRDQLRVGQWAISIGVGYGDVEPALSVGIISALERFAGRAVQADAHTSPANYGGPLADIEGRMIGICVPLAQGSTSAGAGVEWYDSGIGFAIPIDPSDDLFARLRSGDVLYPAFLGVRGRQRVDGPGVELAEVVAEGPAAAAGLQAGDVITSLGSRQVDDEPALRIAISRFVAGERVTVEILRGQERLTFNVTLGQRPDGN